MKLKDNKAESSLFQKRFKFQWYEWIFEQNMQQILRNTQVCYEITMLIRLVEDFNSSTERKSIVKQKKTHT